MTNHFSILNYDDFLNHYSNKINIQEECHIWLGGLNKGYAVIKLTQKNIKLSRFVYLLYYGAYDETLHVLHTCDNPKCVNPRHLFLGTNLDNVKDKVNKNRHGYGSKHWMHKLTEEDIINIVMRFRNGERQKDLALEYGILKSTMSDICNRKTWKHVDV